MLKLLYTQRSPYARKVRIVALEKKIELELIDENLLSKSELLIKSNPSSKVPTLILDNGQSYFDSKVIVQYLEYLTYSPRVIPNDPLKRLEVLKWEALSDDLISVAINVVMEKIRHPQDFNQDFITAGESSIKRAYATIETQLDQLTEFNLSSINLACAIGYIQFRLPHITIEGKLLSWFEAISTRPSLVDTKPVG